MHLWFTSPILYSSLLVADLCLTIPQKIILRLHASIKQLQRRLGGGTARSSNPQPPIFGFELFVSDVCFTSPSIILPVDFRVCLLIGCSPHSCLAAVYISSTFFLVDSFTCSWFCCFSIRHLRSSFLPGLSFFTSFRFLLVSFLVPLLSPAIQLCCPLFSYISYSFLPYYSIS